jgi:hypothetical protein
MKKLAIILSGTLFCLSVMAAKSSDAWVVSGNDRINCEKVNIGLRNAHITLNNGEKMLLPLGDIQSFAKDGKVFDKKMVYRNNKPTGHSQFMQLLKVRNGLNLYRYIGVASDGDTREIYSVYKGDNLYLTLDEKSMPNVFKFFDVKWSVVR